MDKVCTGCGVVFRAPHGNQKYCSKQCTNKVKYLRRKPPVGSIRNASNTMRCSRCQRDMWRNRTTSLPEGQAICLACRRSTPRKRPECPDCGAPCYGQRCRLCAVALRRMGKPPRAEVRRELDRRRVARDRQAPGPFTATARRALILKWKRQGRVCLYCMEAPAETVDHILPLALGGTNYEGNLAPSCAQCNRLKQDNLLSAWRYGVKVKKWRTAVSTEGVKRRVRREKKPVQPVMFNACSMCGVGLAKFLYCSDRCRLLAIRERSRNNYRTRVGIPLDAPLTKSGRPRKVA